MNHFNGKETMFDLPWEHEYDLVSEWRIILASFINFEWDR